MCLVITSYFKPASQPALAESQYSCEYPPYDLLLDDEDDEVVELQPSAIKAKIKTASNIAIKDVVFFIVSVPFLIKQIRLLICYISLYF